MADFVENLKNVGQKVVDTMQNVGDSALDVLNKVDVLGVIPDREEQKQDVPAQDGGKNFMDTVRDFGNNALDALNKIDVLGVIPDREPEGQTEAKAQETQATEGFDFTGAVRDFGNNALDVLNKVDVLGVIPDREETKQDAQEAVEVDATTGATPITAGFQNVSDMFQNTGSAVLKSLKALDVFGIIPDPQVAEQKTESTTELNEEIPAGGKSMADVVRQMREDLTQTKYGQYIAERQAQMKEKGSFNVVDELSAKDANNVIKGVMAGSIQHAMTVGDSASQEWLEDLKSAGSELAETTVFAKAGHDGPKLYSDVKEIMDLTMSTRESGFETYMTLMADGGDPYEGMKNFYVQSMQGVEGFNNGVLEGIAFDDKIRDELLQRDPPMVLPSAEESKEGLAYANCAYTASVMDSLHKMDDKYHFMDMDAWMKIEQLDIYGVDTATLVYHQPGQEIKPVMQDKGLDELGKQLMRESELIENSPYLKEEFTKPVEKTDLSKEEETKRAYEQARTKVLQDPNYTGAEPPTYEEAKKTVETLVEKGTDAVKNFANDLQSGEVSKKIHEAVADVGNTLKTGAENLLNTFTGKGKSAEEVHDERAKVHDERVKLAEGIFDRIEKSEETYEAQHD